MCPQPQETCIQVRAANCFGLFDRSDKQDLQGILGGELFGAVRRHDLQLMSTCCGLITLKLSLDMPHVLLMLDGDFTRVLQGELRWLTPESQYSVWLSANNTQEGRQWGSLVFSLRNPIQGRCAQGHICSIKPSINPSHGYYCKALQRPLSLIPHHQRLVHVLLIGLPDSHRSLTLGGRPTGDLEILV